MVASQSYSVQVKSEVIMIFVIAPPGHFAVEIKSDNEKQARKSARLIYGFNKLPNGTLVAKLY